jgi:class I fructose-bisphosphate aldolase
MKISRRVKEILSHYESDNPGTKTNLARILGHGRLGGTGKMIILPVDQGMEHGPARSFAKNPAGYDPHYHWQMAIDAGLNAFATTLGMMEAGAATFAGQIPTILKVNHSNSLSRLTHDADQAVTATVDDALRLGCSAIGFTIYPGSDNVFNQMEEFRELAADAKRAGLAVVAWSYARGGNISKTGETALDIISYAAHMVATLGAHIVKVKLPTDALELEPAKKVYEEQKILRATLTQRVEDVVNACYGGKRLVVFSGGEAKDLKGLYDEARAIRDGGGNGSIIGRNCFQRPRDEALAMLDQMIEIYKGKSE